MADNDNVIDIAIAKQLLRAQDWEIIDGLNALEAAILRVLMDECPRERIIRFVDDLEARGFRLIRKNGK